MDNTRIYMGTTTGMQILKLSGERAECVGEAFQDEAIEAVKGHGSEPSRIFVAVRDGVYRSRDAGLHWSKVLEGDIRCITIDPSDEHVIYAGTNPVGLYRSEDEGDTWEELVSLLKLPEETHEKLGEQEPVDMSLRVNPGFRHRRQDWWAPEPPHEGHVSNIFVHPDDSNILLLSIEHGGIARSVDRGQTWDDTSGGIDYLDVHVVSNVPNQLDRYLVTSARGLYMTQDPSKGWIRSESGCDRSYFHDMTFLQTANGEDPIAIVASADGSPGAWRRGNRGAHAALYRSTDCGEVWQRIGVGNGLPEEMDSMVWALSGHPDQRNTVIAAVGNYDRALTPDRRVGFGSIILSEDDGENWRTVADGMPAVKRMFVAAG
jgi:photosystem II stability/assembly factor-like uncharacterized protein